MARKVPVRFNLLRHRESYTYEPEIPNSRPWRSAAAVCRDPITTAPTDRILGAQTPARCLERAGYKGCAALTDVLLDVAVPELVSDDEVKRFGGKCGSL